MIRCHDIKQAFMGVYPVCDTVLNIRIRDKALTIVTLSISPVVPEVGVLLEVLSYTCCSHPGTLQKQYKKEVSGSIVLLFHALLKLQTEPVKIGC